MGVAKASLIVVGTVAGLGGVLAYQPPHQSLGLSGGGLGGGLKGLGGGSTTPAATATPTPTPTETVASTPAPTPTKTTPKTRKPVAVPVTTPTPKKTTPPKKAAINGTFTGATSSTAYGPVQIQIQVVNSKIVAVNALKLPTATPYDVQLNGQAVPILTQETIAASSSNIQGVTGASYTSQGWYDSLVSALAKAGMPG